MERKILKFRSSLRRILSLSVCVALLVCAMVLPVSASGLDYNDYITDIKVNGDLDLVTVSFPVDEFAFNLYRVDNDQLIGYQTGSNCFFDLPSDLYVQLAIGPKYSISLDNIPGDTQFTVVFDTSVSHGYIDETNLVYQGWFYYSLGTDNHKWVAVNGFRSSGECTIQGNLDSSYSDFTPYFYFYNFCGSPLDGVSSVEFRLSVTSFQATFSISSLYRLQQETGKTNVILTEVQKQLAENGQTLEEVLQQQEQTNDKLDDLISGGSGADDLIAGGDKIENAGDGLGEDIGKIEDFENQYMGQLEDNLGDVIAGADLTWLYPPLMFVQRYLNKIVAAIPSKYLIVFTLPMLFGLFMYIVGHPVRAPRPDTSGDQVTRETFTETTILKGPHAGRVSATRTVTTSQEIGRVHNE